MLATILIEGCVVVFYCTRHKKNAGRLIAASLLVNALTQVALWAALQVFFQQYIVALFAAEMLIWLAESFLLYYLVRQQLTWSEAFLLSLMMNAASFGVGWFLPV